jgi:hypothetical protein
VLNYCWAIVAACHKIYKMIDQPLKPYQVLIDCCCPKEKKVYLYHYQYALDYIKKEGIRVMSQYEFIGVKGNCKPTLEVIRKQFLLFIIIIIVIEVMNFLLTKST